MLSRTGYKFVEPEAAHFIDAGSVKVGALAKYRDEEANADLIGDKDDGTEQTLLGDRVTLDDDEFQRRANGPMRRQFNIPGGKANTFANIRVVQEHHLPTYCFTRNLSPAAVQSFAKIGFTACYRISDVYYLAHIIAAAIATAGVAMDLMVGPVEYVESIETAWDQEPPPAEVSLFRKHRRFAVQDEGRIYWTKPDFKEPTFLNLDEARRMFTRVF